nr:flagellar FlbD family protein [uncultured Lachnoclostridium sp.]
MSDATALDAGSSIEGREDIMINLTRLNDIPFTLNCDLIEIIEEVPDTVITLVNGKKIFVKESRQNVVSLVKLYKKEVFCQTISQNDE